MWIVQVLREGAETINEGSLIIVCFIDLTYAPGCIINQIDLCRDGGGLG